MDYRTPGLAREALRPLVAGPVASRTWVQVQPDSRASAPGVEVLELSTNPGFGAAANQGVARGRSPLVLLLNPDAVLALPDLEQLVGILATRRDAAAVTPRLVRPDGSEDRSHGVFPERLARLVDRPRPRRGVVAADWLAATCLLIRRRDFEAVGGFDPRFFLYCEDVDLCRRLAGAGRRVLVAGDVLAAHLGGASFSDPADRRRHYTRGRRTYLARHASPWQRLGYEAYLAARRWLGASPEGQAA